MENLKKKLESVQETTDASNQSPTGADTEERLVDKLQSPTLLNDKRETNTVDEHGHHHISLDVERMENLSSSAMLLKYKELICERDSKLNELKRINDNYEQELFLKENRIKQLTVGNEELENEYILHAAQNDEDKNVIDEDQSRIYDSKLQSNDSSEDDLNEYCLLEIFSYLSIEDMIQVKRVCNKWYDVSQQWFKQVQSLVYSEDFDGTGRLRLYEKYYKRKIYEGTETKKFVSILRSCGHHIMYFKTDISLDGRFPTDICEKFIFDWVPKLCENIVDLEIYNSGAIDDKEWNFEVMATHWRKLEKINIQYFPAWGIRTFYELLRNNKRLETLQLYLDYEDYYDEDCDRNTDDEFFTYLPTTIKKISITHMIDSRERLSHFISASKNFTSLQSLELLDFYYLTDAVVAAIVDIKSLTDLSLHHIYHYESCRTIDLIANMKGLKSLDLSDNRDLREDSFINILGSCIQLEQLLTVRHRGLLTDKGMTAIAKLEKLKYLYIDMKNVTNESIINLCDRLEILWCWNSKMNNNEAIKLLKKGTNLKLLIFTYSINLTKDFLQAAIEIANERKNILYIASNLSGVGNIDTPYLKYFSSDKNIPLEIFPEGVRGYMKRTIDICPWIKYSWMKYTCMTE